MARDKNTICNQVVVSAADLMEAKVRYNSCLADQLEAKCRKDQADNLRECNVRILQAVSLMREWEGCWA